MRLRLAILLGLVSTLYCLPLLAADLYVAPDGSDDNSGTLAEPFATLGHARDVVRQIKGTTADPITVYLRRGTVRLLEPLVFSPEDSGTVDAPITYAAYGDEEVVIKGSRPLQLAWHPHKEGIFQAKVPTGLVFDQLFLGGTRQHRARFPNFDPRDPLRSGPGYQLVTGGSNHRHDTFIEFDPEQFTKNDWADPTTGIVHAFQSHNWGNMQYRVKDIDRQTNQILLGDGGWQLQRIHGIGAGRGSSSPFYIENIFEELDAPGEWFLDTTSDTLYFYPPSGVDLSRALLEAVVTKDLIQFIGSSDNPVHHIRLRGLEFTQCRTTFMEEYEPLARGDWAIHRGGAVFLEGAENCRVDDCNFQYVGGNGVFMSKYNRENIVSGCRFFHTGESGVAFVGSPEAVRVYLTWDMQELDGIKWEEKLEGMDLEPGPKTPDYPKDCTVENSVMYEIGDFGKQTSGAVISMSSGITVSHCTIYNIPRAGVTINDGTWGGHIIEHCDIWETVRESGEHGPFNSWGRERFWNGLIKDLVFLDAVDPVHIRNNRIANYRKSLSAGNWTIDLDDGSSNYHIYNNLSLGSTLKLRDGYYRKVWNNIHVSPVELGWHCWPSENEDSFCNNIVVISGARPGMAEPTDDFLSPRGSMCDHPWGRQMDNNLYWNINTKDFRLVGNDFDAWKQLGYDQNSVVADPQFVDPANGDYRVADDSPALKVGFENFAMDQFGHQMTRIEPFGGEFEDQTTVTLKPDARGGVVHYTLDGSRPTPQSPKYAEPLVLTESTTVTALTFQDGTAQGFAESTDFTQVDELVPPTWLASLLAGEWTGAGEIDPEAVAEPAAPKKQDVVWLGATLVDITHGDLIDSLGGVESGVCMIHVPEDSKAFELGFRPADVIIGYNGREISKLSVLSRRIRSISAADVEIDITRSYERSTIIVPGRFKLSATDATIIGADTRLVEDHIGFWRNAESSVQWEVVGLAPGTYEVEIEYACMASKAGTTFELAIGDQSLSGTVESTGSWSKYQTFSLGKVVASSQGKTQVAVRPVEIADGAVMNLRAVRLNPIGQ